MDSSAGLTCDFHSRCPFISIGGEKRRETPEITPETVITVCNPANVFLNADGCQLFYGRSIISARAFAMVLPFLDFDYDGFDELGDWKK